MLPRPVGPAVDEAHRLPVLVDRAALVVDQACVEADSLHRREVEVGLQLRRLLRPCDPEAVRGRERSLERAEAPLQLCGAGRDVDEDVGSGPGAELARELSQAAAARGTRPPPRT